MQVAAVEASAGILDRGFMSLIEIYKRLQRFFFWRISRGFINFIEGLQKYPSRGPLACVVYLGFVEG